MLLIQFAVFLDGDPLKSLPNVAQAAFDHHDRRHDPVCLRDTRVKVLEEITKWSNERGEPHIFWVNGMAGVGKSTIARTVARTLADVGRLGASFFFSRGGGDLGNAGKVFTTLAFQLSKVSSDLKRYICEAVKQHPDIAEKAPRDQLEQLIFRPVSRLKEDSFPFPIIFVLDALDECDGDRDIQQILQLLTEEWAVRPGQLRILVTSRPETPIRLGFRNIPEFLHYDLVLHDIPRDVVDHDISIYFQQELKNIEVPGHDFELLIEKACGLFIWAATACRYIKSGKFITKRLHTVLKGGPGERNPEKELDEMYTRIILASISGEDDDEYKEQLFALFRKIAGAIVTIFDPLSTDSLAQLLDISKSDTKATLNDLHSVLDVPENLEKPVQLLHPSFRDFLTEQRCPEERLRVDEKQMHQDLANSCLGLMSKGLKVDICHLGLPGALVNELSNSKVKQHISAELRYACRYWVSHIQRIEGSLHDGDDTHKFLQAHFLHWLEVLSLIGHLPDSVRMVIELQSMVVSYSKCLSSINIQN